MEIKNTFDVPLPPDEAWKVLLDIERIMPCVPGAELVEVLGDGAYKGKVSIKLGPVALSFVGTAKFDNLDESAKRATVSAKGSDAKGRGGANAAVNFHLSPVGGGTRVEVQTNVNLSGAVAQYGRGTGVIQGVATQLTQQFADNLKAMLAHEQAKTGASLSPAPLGSSTEPGASSAPIYSSDQAAPTPMPVAKPISGFSLMFKVLRGMVAGFFSRGGKAAP
jgi:carbon monoxide dehydrogenase subunit G